MCQLVRTLNSDDLKLESTNAMIYFFDRSTTNGIEVIDIKSIFKMPTGGVHDISCNVHEDIAGFFFNRLGAIRLVDWNAKNFLNFKQSDKWK